MTVEATEVDSSRTLRSRGALVLAPFALLWSLVAISGLPASSLWAARVGAAVITAATLFLVMLAPSGAGTQARVLSAGYRLSLTGVSAPLADVDRSIA